MAGCIRGQQGDEAPQTEGVEAKNQDNTKKLRTETIRQALAESRDTSPLSHKYRDLHSRMISHLAAKSENEDLITQTRVDDIYAEIIAHIEPKRSTRVKIRTRTRDSKTQAGCKRKRKKYIYARTQELFRKNPNLLAKYIREGTPWLDKQDSRSPKTEEVKSFYNSLWGTQPEITIPFAVSESDQKALEVCEVFQTITAQDITERIKRMRKSTAPGPDGVERKHLSSLDMREIMPILFNIILVSKTQPKAWNANRTILIPKEGKDPSRIQNYRPQTISSLICRTYWGIVDKKLREVLSFSPRQKDFVHETGCFNNVHILNETIKAAKDRNGLVAVQLDTAKAFNTVPHKAIEAALCPLSLPQYVRETITNSYKSLKTTIEYSGSQRGRIETWN
jgi:hypothetical protein